MNMLGLPGDTQPERPAAHTYIIAQRHSLHRVRRGTVPAKRTGHQSRAQPPLPVRRSPCPHGMALTANAAGPQEFPRSDTTFWLATQHSQRAPL